MVRKSQLCHPNPLATLIQTMWIICDKKGKLKQRSWVWKHFEKLPLGPKNEARAKCYYCGITYRSASSNNSR